MRMTNWLMWLTLAAAIAQAASVRGRVTDAGGAPVAGVTVIASKAGEMASRQVTGTEGDYRFEDLEPGVYSLKVTRAGFAVYLAGKLVVTRATNDVVNNISLQVTPPPTAAPADEAPEPRRDYQLTAAKIPTVEQLRVMRFENPADWAPKAPVRDEKAVSKAVDWKVETADPANGIYDPRTEGRWRIRF